MRTAILICMISYELSSALPVTKHETEEKPSEPNEHYPTEFEKVEYERYLKQVVELLESDKEFKKKLDKAPVADIRDGKIAEELDYVNHNVRTKLDEIKRQELDRLRHLASKQYELSNHIDREHLKIPQHLDHENEHTFEIEDLRKLILKTSEDLAEADRKRREEFKNYEMQKEFENQQKMKGMDEEHRKKYEHELVEKQKKHNQHEKVHHPGSKAQLEEVWEKQDEMDKGDFDPKIFFKMHDLDDNGFWDEAEVKALFVKELDKVYEKVKPEDDMREREEEMERMRENYFLTADTNHDYLISYEEFIETTKSEEYYRDPTWNTIDSSTLYSENEYKQFEMEREREIKQLIEQGKLKDVIQDQEQSRYPQQQHTPQGHPSYQQQETPQLLPQQNPVDHVPHQQMHVPQLHQTQGNVHPQQQQVPQQQQQYVPHQQIPQQQAAQTNPQLVVPEKVPQQLPQQNIHQAVNQAL